MLPVSNNSSLYIPKSATENNFNVNKDIENFFPYIVYLLDFLKTEDTNEIEKKFKIKNANEFIISIKYLIKKYLEKNHYISLIQLEMLEELTCCVFPNVNKSELNEIKCILSEYFKTEFYNPTRFLSFAHAVDIFRKVLDKMVEANLLNTNKKNLNEKKSVVLKDILNLIESEQKVVSIVSRISKKLFDLNSYIATDKTVKISNNKIMFLIDEKAFHLLKNEKSLNLKLDIEKKYVTLNLVKVLNLRKNSKYLSNSECGKFIKTATNIAKLFNLIDSLDGITFKKISSHNDLFYFLYNHLDNIKNKKNDIINLLKLRGQFKMDVLSFQRNTEHLLNFFKTYSENEFKVLNTSFKNKKEHIFNKLGQKCSLYVKLNSSFYKDFSNHKIYMNILPEHRIIDIIGEFKGGEFQTTDIEILIHLFLVVANEILILKLLKEFFIKFKSEIQHIKESNIIPEKKQKMILELQQIKLKLNTGNCCSNFSANHAFHLNTIIYQMLVSKFACMSLKKLESNYWLSILIDDLYAIVKLDKSYTKQQILLCDGLKSYLRLKVPNQFNENLIIHRESIKTSFELFEEIKLIASKDFVIKYAALHAKPSNIEMFFDDLTSKSIKENDSNVENIENVLPPKNEPKINVSVKNKKNKRNKELSSAKESPKNIKPSLFGIPSPAVLLRGNPYQIAPQLVVMQKEIQTKNIQYISSEFHQINQKLPGESPPWSDGCEHYRVSRWKDVTYPLCEVIFPRYQSGNAEEKRINQETQIFYHTMPKIAHRFINQLCFKEKTYRDLLQEGETIIKRQKSVKYTAVARIAKLEQIGDIYISRDEIEGSYAVELRDGVVFHDAFSPQKPPLKIAKSAKNISNLICKEFENKNYFIQTYLKSNGKVSVVHIDDKLKLKRLYIYKTKR